MAFFTEGARSSFCLLGLLLLVSASNSFAEDGESEFQENSRRTLRQYPENVGRGMIGLFNRENVTPFLLSAAAVGLSSLVDDDVRERIMDDDDELSDAAEDYFGALAMGIVTTGLFISGQNSDDPVYRDMSYDMGVAVASNVIVTMVLKEAVGRTRPNEADDKSFPSGHTSNAFTMATVLDAHYGRRAGIPAYVLASLVGISRIRRDAHWLSDVVAGAALGYLTGRTVVRQNSKSDRKVTFTPSLSSSFQGLVIQTEF